MRLTVWSIAIGFVLRYILFCCISTKVKTYEQVPCSASVSRFFAHDYNIAAGMSVIGLSSRYIDNM